MFLKLSVLLSECILIFLLSFVPSVANKPFMLSVVMQNFVVLNAVMLIAVMLIVIMLNVIMLNVMLLKTEADDATQNYIT